MNYTRLNADWEPEPNAPCEELSVQGNTLTLTFTGSDLTGPERRLRLRFMNGHKYAYGSPNMDGFYRGLHRYSGTRMPWGDFYHVDTDWQTDFPTQHTVLQPYTDKRRLSLFVFFFRDSTFECVAEWYLMETLQEV